MRIAIPSHFSAVDYNACYFPNAQGEWQDGSGNATPLASWRAASGFDQHSFIGDPKFTNPGMLDLTPLAGSPLINAGDPNLSAAEDLTRKTRTTPDIGAFEF
jgi:hypothetical protein